MRATRTEVGRVRVVARERWDPRRGRHAARANQRLEIGTRHRRDDPARQVHAEPAAQCGFSEEHLVLDDPPTYHDERDRKYGATRTRRARAGATRGTSAI